MDATRACPRCAALAQTRQRWCLECGAELPAAGRRGLRPAVGIATVLALLVGAASAGGYTLLRHQAQPPPPATTVAASPPASTPPATTGPSASTFNPPSYSTPSAPSYKPVPLPGSSGSSSGTSGSTHGDSGGASASIPHGSGGSATPTAPTTTPATTPTTPTPQLALTDVALGAAAVVYAPYAPASADLGDASRVVDGTTRTAWRTPSFAAGADPQLGVYVDLASAQKLRKLVLATPTPGMSVEVYGATQGPPDSITAPGWDHLASRHGIGASTTIGLGDRSERYVLVWIVGLPPGATSAAISELSLLSLQPE
jgi:hypothetical protein